MDWEAETRGRSQLGRSPGKPAEVMRALTKGLAMLYLLMLRQSCAGGMRGSWREKLGRLKHPKESSEDCREHPAEVGDLRV